MSDTPETDELARSLLYERLASTETCYYEMRMLSRKLEQKFNSERALADRLAEAIEAIWPFIEEDIPHGCNSTAYMNAIELCRANITPWKEARSEI